MKDCVDSWRTSTSQAHPGEPPAQACPGRAGRAFQVDHSPPQFVWLIGTYHGVSRDQLQVYLDEFVFRHNRRRLPMAAFQTLLGLGAGRKPTAYNDIRGAVDLSRSKSQAIGAS